MEPEAVPSILAEGLESQRRAHDARVFAAYDLVPV